MTHIYCYTHMITDIWSHIWMYSYDVEHMIVYIWLTDIWSRIWLHSYGFLYMIHTYDWAHMIANIWLFIYDYQTYDHTYEFSPTISFVQISKSYMDQIYVHIREIIYCYTYMDRIYDHIYETIYECTYMGSIYECWHMNTYMCTSDFHIPPTLEMQHQPKISVRLYLFSKVCEQSRVIQYYYIVISLI